jgi:hypothetical protein
VVLLPAATFTSRVALKTILPAAFTVAVSARTMPLWSTKPP